MTKTLAATFIALAFLAAPEAIAAAKKKPGAPTGAERQRQFLHALKECRKLYGGGSISVDAEWGTNYGRTGWWCVTLR